MNTEPSTADDARRDRRFATTLARGLSVLRAFRSGDDGLGNADIAARARLPKSTVSRLTFTLRALGYLEQSRGDDRYRPGPALLALGNVASGAVSIVERASPLMQALADETGTLAVLAVRDDRKLLLVRTWRPLGVASLWLEVGHRVPIARSSSGHALLGALSTDEVVRLVDAAAAEDGLAGGRGERLHAQAFDELGDAGFVIADPRDYFTPNIHAASVPFRASGTAEPIMFTCGGTPADLPLTRLRRVVGPRLRTAVEELARITGGTVTPRASTRRDPATRVEPEGGTSG